MRGDVLRVGVTEHEPWVSLQSSEPSGVEVALIRDFAAGLDAEVQYTAGSEQELVEAVERRQLDVVIGGFSDRTPWRKNAAMTKPYMTTELVLGTPDGREVRDGERVATEAGTDAGWWLEKETGLEADPRESLEGVDGPAVVDEWLLDDLGLERAEELAHVEHVMLAAPGENAFLMELERYLQTHQGRARGLLYEEGEL